LNIAKGPDTSILGEQGIKLTEALGAAL